MKIILFALCLFVFNTCSAEEKEPSPSEQEYPPMDSVNEEFDHEAFDQELLAGGKQKRQELSELSPEEAAKEIKSLIIRIDHNKDGKLDKVELVAWLEKVEDSTYQSEADEVFSKEDRDGDGFITFEEYWLGMQGEAPPDGDSDEAQKSVKVRFEDADTNKDGHLDKKEFAPFLHPFRHQHMIGHLVRDQLDYYDHDKDGKISLEEYIQSFSTDDGEEETPTDAPWVEEERKEFTDKLDTDHDGVLNDAEIQQWLAPSEKGFHEEEANHLLQHADKDKDGFLTLEEIEAEFDEFLNSPVTDFGNTKTVHEEL